MSFWASTNKKRSAGKIPISLTFRASERDATKKENSPFWYHLCGERCFNQQRHFTQAVYPLDFTLFCHWLLALALDRVLLRTVDTVFHFTAIFTSQVCGKRFLPLPQKLVFFTPSPCRPAADLARSSTTATVRLQRFEAPRASVPGATPRA